MICNALQNHIMIASLVSFCHYFKSRSIFCDVELLCTSQCLTLHFVYFLRQEQKDPHHHPQVPSWWELWGLGLWWAHHNRLNSLSSLYWQNNMCWFTPTIASGQSATQTQKSPVSDAVKTNLLMPQFDPRTSITSGHSVWAGETWMHEI